MKSQLGAQGENAALEWLKRHKGFTYLARNFHTRWGEIDLIMQDKDQTIVFIEVKSRMQSKYGSVLEQISPKKISRLKRAIEFYLHKNGWDDQSCRLDGIGIEYEKNEDEEYVPLDIRYEPNLTGW